MLDLGESAHGEGANGVFGQPPFLVAGPVDEVLGEVDHLQVVAPPELETKPVGGREPLPELVVGGRQGRVLVQ